MQMLPTSVLNFNFLALLAPKIKRVCQNLMWLCAGFILAGVVRVKNENGRKFTHKK